MKKQLIAAALAIVLSAGSIATPIPVVQNVIVAEAAETTALAAPQNIKGKVSKDSIVLSWDKVEGADAYRVYIFNAETKKYEKYKTITGTKCTVKSLESGKTYYFKVTTMTKSGKSYVKNGTSEKVSVKMTAKKTDSKKKTENKKAECDSWNGMFPTPESYGFEFIQVTDDNRLWYANFDDYNAGKQFKKYLKYLEDSGCKLIDNEELAKKSDYCAYALDIYDSTGKNKLAQIYSDFDFEMWITLPVSNK